MSWSRTLVAAALLLVAGSALAQLKTDDCLGCHQDPEAVKEVGGKKISVHVDPARFKASRHGAFECTDCHQSIADYPHEKVTPVDCTTCHDAEATALAKSVHGKKVEGKAAVRCYDCHGNHEIRKGSDAITNCVKCHAKIVDEQHQSLHGRAAARGDKLAPTCLTCHGSHSIQSHLDPAARTAVMNIPLLCGGCHREGSQVSLSYNIPQDRILENYRDSIHGAGLFQKGLTVTAVCTSCHTSHFILPHTDPRSSIAKANIAHTCTQCHARIESVHRKVIDGKLWEKEPHKIPACPDCHQPHEIRRVFYDAGMANKDCLTCHAKRGLTMVRNGQKISIFVDPVKYAASRHSQKACAQCHTEVTPSRTRACETIKTKVDCSICHAAQVADYRVSMHGQLAAKGDPDAPHCLDCHSYHETQSKRTPSSPTYARNVPVLCARCHQRGHKAAVRIKSEVIRHRPDLRRLDSRQGTPRERPRRHRHLRQLPPAHRELPPSDPRSTMNPENLAGTCGTCHRGIEEKFERSIHAPGKPKPATKLPTCNDCHSSHAIERTDLVGFRTKMMNQCGRCHQEEAETFFDTFHGKVSRLGTEDGEMLRLPRPARHPAARDPRSHAQPRQRREDLRPVPPGLEPPLRRLPHPRHPPRSEEVSVALLVVPGHDVAARRHAGVLPPAHAALALPRSLAVPPRAGSAQARGRGEVYVHRFRTLPAQAAPDDDLQLLHAGARPGMTLKFSYAGWAQRICLASRRLRDGGLHPPRRARAHVLALRLHLFDLVQRKAAEKLAWLQYADRPG